MWINLIYNQIFKKATRVFLLCIILNFFHFWLSHVFGLQQWGDGGFTRKGFAAPVSDWLYQWCLVCVYVCVHVCACMCFFFSPQGLSTGLRSVATAAGRVVTTSAIQRQTWRWPPPGCGLFLQGCNAAATTGSASCSAPGTGAMGCLV